jgi:hypothetical protein
MRYQERIYPQTNVSALRNKDITIFNMSSDICVFNAPTYYVSGTTILDCTVLSATSVSGYSHIISANTDNISLGFVFTSNTESFSGNNVIFNYKLYQFEENNNSFTAIPSFTSNDIYFSSLTSSATTQLIPSSGLTLDSEYMIKGFYRFSACTEYMGKLGNIIDTSKYVGGNEYGIYNKNFDYYFAAIEAAATPQFNYNASNSVANGSLQQSYLPINYYTIYPDIDQLDINFDEEEFGEGDAFLPEQNNTMIGIPAQIDTPFILTLNGLVLALGADYTYSGNSIVYFNEPLVPEDVVTIIYTSSSPNTIKNDIIEVLSVIPSGATNGQGDYLVYFNTTTSRYELYTSAKPIDFSKVLLMINGVMLANGLDFYQSTSNPRRIILNGDIVLNDIITISYFPDGVVGDIITQKPTASWFVTPSPKKDNGYFTLQLSTDIGFSNIVYSAVTDYYVDTPFYSVDFPVSGYTYGDRLFYRVRNDKNYETICGKIINSFAYSDIIPITIATNSINSY